MQGGSGMDGTEAIEAMAKRVIDEFAARGLTVATAESCTGGLIAKTLTDIAGSSAVFAGACVTYTNGVKERLLGVDPATIARETEVSHACAGEMAACVRQKLGVDVGVSTTGYAGPGGGTARDPVGTVYIGWSTARESGTERFCAPAGADRSGVREAATLRVLEILLSLGEG